MRRGDRVEGEVPVVPPPVQREMTQPIATSSQHSRRSVSGTERPPMASSSRARRSMSDVDMGSVGSQSFTSQHHDLGRDDEEESEEEQQMHEESEEEEQQMHHTSLLLVSQDILQHFFPFVNPNFYIFH